VLERRAGQGHRPVRADGRRGHTVVSCRL